MSSFNEHPGQTNRAPASAFLLIDSADRTQVSELGNVLVQDLSGSWLNYTQSVNDFTIQKRQPFVSGYFNRLAVTECRFEFNSPNINERNNKIVILDSTANAIATITIDEGFYTPVELAASLTIELNTTPAIQAAWPGLVWTVTYIDAPATNACFKIENNGTDVMLQSFFFSPFIYPSPSQTLKSLFFIMGLGVGNTAEGFFTQQLALFSNDSAIWQLGNVFPPMCYTRYVDVCSRSLTQYQRVKDNSTRENQTPAVLARIYLATYTNEGLGDGDTSAQNIWPGCRPCVIHRIWNVPKYSSWSPGQFIDNIDIQLRDDAGNLLYIPTNISAETGQTPAQLELYGAQDTPNQFQLTLHCSES